MGENQNDNSQSTCIHCGKCVEVCPMRLVPNYLAIHSKLENYEMAEKYNISSCVECGACTYICPGNVPIVQYIRTQKFKAIEKQREGLKNNE